MTDVKPLPKRKPARRTTMQPQPEPAPEPQPERHLDWAQLTAPLERYQVPVIFTPVMRAAADEWQDEYRGQAAADQELLDEWHGKALLATFGPLLDWLHRFTPPPPAMLP